MNLVGPEALSAEQRWDLEGAALIKEGVLQQSALDAVDTFCSPEKQFALLELALRIYNLGKRSVQAGAPVQELQRMPVLDQARRAKARFPSDQLDDLRALRDEVDTAFEQLIRNYTDQEEHTQ